MLSQTPLATCRKKIRLKFKGLLSQQALCHCAQVRVPYVQPPKLQVPIWTLNAGPAGHHLTMKSSLVERVSGLAVVNCPKTESISDSLRVQCSNVSKLYSS